LKTVSFSLGACALLAILHGLAGMTGLALMWISVPLLLLVKQVWVRVALPILLVLGGLFWIVTVVPGWQSSIAPGVPTLGLIGVLSGVASSSLGAALAFQNRRQQSEAITTTVWAGASALAFFLTFALLAMVQWKMVQPVGVLLERFIPAGGWLQAFWLSTYAAWLTEKLRLPGLWRVWRPRVWRLFSAVFFLQLILGLAGLKQFLMTGKLHLPVPALIVAGPLYRGGGLFMLILFSASLLLVGPAWCSWLCYIGSWDDLAARQRKLPRPLPQWRRHVRWAILVLIIAVAYLLGRLGISGVAAAWLAGAFGLAGVGLMVIWSRRTGMMTHCTTYCPIGWLATRLGKLSPFRIKINDACTDCGVCTTVCRFDALGPEDIQRRQPGEACTLCGDCIGRCKARDIEYRFLGLSTEKARTVFLVLVVSLHAVFLGVARL